jgi:serine/threonine protein kinase
MAPEVRWNRGAADPCADVYSFGMTVLEAFSGTKPWLVHKYPPLVADFVLRATRENPKDRFQTMGEALEAWKGVEASVHGRESSVPEAVLRAVSAPPDRHDVLEVIGTQGDRRVFSLDEPITLVGRSREACRIVLDDTEISRVHVKIVREDGEAYAFDMGSHNGTFVGGQPTRAVKLAEGMEIRVGNTLLRYL